MKTNWDYTSLADAYLKRPDYSEAAIKAMLSIAEVRSGDKACDVGAGVAHLTLMLAKYELSVKAVEPNDAMRNNGIKRTSSYSNVDWSEGTGEQTGQPSNSFDLVTFGSSFNVCDRNQALAETARLLRDKGWFACMWNHRDLNETIQAKIEAIIKSNIKAYGYGTRREDQTKIIKASQLFGDVVKLEGEVIHSQTIDECVEAWRSHATLQRQAGDKFNSIISEINEYLTSLNVSSIEIPYKTNIWIAQKI